MAWTARSFVLKRTNAAWPLILLRFMGTLAPTLFVPIVGLLLSAFNCADNTEQLSWSQDSGQCWTGLHIAGMVVAGAGVPVLCVTTGLTTMLYVDL